MGNNVTQVLPQCYLNEEHCYTEIEKEIDKEKEIEIDKEVNNVTQMLLFSKGGRLGEGIITYVGIENPLFLAKQKM